jgi:hypothetical protein
LNQKTQQQETNIEVTGYRYTSDWFIPEKRQIDTSEVWGFNLDWRGGPEWHIVIKPKDKFKTKYIDDEVGHGVDLIETKTFLNNRLVKILKVVNFHHSDNFNQAIRELFVTQKEGTTKQ